MKEHNKKVVLICDLGGTNVRFGLYHENQQELIYFNGKYKCADFPSFEAVVDRYLKDHKTTRLPSLCVIGAAGDIDENNGKILATNTPWTADIQHLKNAFPFIQNVKLVNDFALQGWALSELSKESYQSVFNKGLEMDIKNEKIVLIGPGTGLGTCVIMPNSENNVNIYTSEAGHSTIPRVHFDDEKDQKLNEKLLNAIETYYCGKKMCPITEHIVSGTGISNIYHAIKYGFIPSIKSCIEPAEKIEEMAQKGDEVALKTFDLFNAYLGAHSGTMAATTKANIVFFCGGVMASSWIRERLEKTPYFKEQFIPRSGLTQTMKNIHIFVSTDRDMSKLGAGVFARNMINQEKRKEKENQTNQDIIHMLYYLQSFISLNYPEAEKPIKKVIRIVNKKKREDSGILEALIKNTQHRKEI